jgi:Protein kinase domain
MGVVWLAEDELVGRRVAVKELRPPGELAGEERETFSRRALAEARSAARVHHPAAVTLFDVLPASGGDDAVYLIMELVEGPTLAQLLERNGALPAPLVAGYGLQLLSVLAVAHELGVVHRDIKPANIMIAVGGQVKLAGCAPTATATSAQPSRARPPHPADHRGRSGSRHRRRRHPRSDLAALRRSGRLGRHPGQPGRQRRQCGGNLGRVQP